MPWFLPVNFVSYMRMKQWLVGTSNSSEHLLEGREKSNRPVGSDGWLVESYSYKQNSRNITKQKKNRLKKLPNMSVVENSHLPGRYAAS